MNYYYKRLTICIFALNSFHWKPTLYFRLILIERGNRYTYNVSQWQLYCSYMWIYMFVCVCICVCTFLHAWQQWRWFCWCSSAQLSSIDTKELLCARHLLSICWHWTGNAAHFGIWFSSVIRLVKLCVNNCIYYFVFFSSFIAGSLP